MLLVLLLRMLLGMLLRVLRHLLLLGRHLLRARSHPGEDELTSTLRTRLDILPELLRDILLSTHSGEMWVMSSIPSQLRLLAVDILILVPQPGFRLDLDSTVGSIWLIRSRLVLDLRVLLLLRLTRTLALLLLLLRGRLRALGLLRSRIPREMCDLEVREFLLPDL